MAVLADLERFDTGDLLISANIVYRQKVDIKVSVDPYEGKAVVRVIALIVLRSSRSVLSEYVADGYMAHLTSHAASGVKICNSDTVLVICPRNV